MRPVLLILLLLCTSCISRGQQYNTFSVRTPISKDEFLILGFVGGRVSWNNDKEGVRNLALRIRALQKENVHVETVENQKRNLAIRLIRNAIDQNQDGILQNPERASARLILYGQSFGGAAVIKLARQLETLRIPVLMTIQVDSVGRQDEVVPANVRNAANLFQRNGRIIRGEPMIRAADPSKTKIIGNLRFDYSNSTIDISKVPWWKKLFRTAHTRMNYDPEVWNTVESLILNEITGQMRGCGISSVKAGSNSPTWAFRF